MDGPPDGISLMAGLVRPESRGEVRLSSHSAWDPPVIDPRVLPADADAEALGVAVRLCQEIVGATERRRTWGTRGLYPGPLAKSADGLRSYVRQSVVTYHHQGGTCKMGVDDESVVDPRLRVQGVDGLRIADASIMLDVPAGNTNAPAIMIGEKAADLLVGG